MLSSDEMERTAHGRGEKREEDREGHREMGRQRRGDGEGRGG